MLSVAHCSMHVDTQEAGLTVPEVVHGLVGSLLVQEEVAVHHALLQPSKGSKQVCVCRALLPMP